MRKREKRRHINWVSVFGCIALLIGSYIFLKQEYEIYQIEKARTAAAQRIEVLEQEQKKLTDEKKRLDDPKYIEKLARENYNMVGKNEVPLFIVEEKK